MVEQWLVNFNPLKTEVVTFSLADREHQKLIFDNINFTPVQHHIHLGVTSSNDGTWHEHRYII
jgi:hypothetical protein